MAEDKDRNVHEGHRQRLRQRYIKEGLQSFGDHEILELMLFYSYHSRMDTNVPAHRLLNAFNGSLVSIFNASVDEIMKKGKVSEKVAVQLSMVSQLVRYYVEKSAETGEILNSARAMERRVISLFSADDRNIETFHMIILTERGSNMIYKKDVVIKRGAGDSIDFTMKEIVEIALGEKAKFVVLAHNHPGGNLRPSAADINTTERIKEYLEPLGIRVIDHIIVCENKSFSFADHRLCNMSYSNDRR